MKTTKHARLASGVVFLIACIWPAPAIANMGVPYIAILLFWAFWVLLVPVIIIEAIVIYRRLSLKRSTAWGVSIVANLVSCFVGAIVMVLNEILFAEAGFAAYYGWAAKIPFYAILVPCYFMSVWLEAFVAKQVIEKTYREISRAFYVANAYSYVLLAVLGAVVTMGPY